VIAAELFVFVDVGNAAFSSSVIVLLLELEDELGREDDEAEEVGFPVADDDDDPDAGDDDEDVDALDLVEGCDTALLAALSGSSTVVYSSMRNSKNPSSVKNPIV
jgi:hypothetical protein